jgi:uncharacterized protein YndB with AHSA1/START domain
MDDNKLVIERIFNAPKEMVWQAWTDPALVKQWWGPAHFTAPSVKIDLTAGGKYVYAMRGPVGTEWDQVTYSAGVFKEIVPQEKLIISAYFSDEEGNMIEPTKAGMDPNFPKEMTITVLFETVDDDKSKLSIVYVEPESKEQVEAMLKSGMKEGWGSSLEKMAKVVEK